VPGPLLIGAQSRPTRKCIAPVIVGCPQRDEEIAVDIRIAALIGTRQRFGSDDHPHRDRRPATQFTAAHSSTSS
jgi:hypothetical protein